MIIFFHQNHDLKTDLLPCAIYWGQESLSKSALKHVVKWNISFSPILSLLSSLGAQLCKSVTKLALDSCVTQCSLTEFPVCVCDLVGIPAMSPQRFQDCPHAFERKVIVLSGSSNHHEWTMNQDGKHEGNALLKDKETHNFCSASQMTHPRKGASFF